VYSKSFDKLDETLEVLEILRDNDYKLDDLEITMTNDPELPQRIQKLMEEEPMAYFIV